MLEGENPHRREVRRGSHQAEDRTEDRIDRHRAQYQNFKRLTILALREKPPFGRGREQILSRVVGSEDPDEAWNMVRKHVRKGSKIHADEHFSYDDLVGLQEVFLVNHSKECQTKGGVNTNTSRASSAASSEPMAKPGLAGEWIPAASPTPSRTSIAAASCCARCARPGGRSRRPNAP
nr:transposase [Mesorhizobium mediterraneum]